MTLCLATATLCAVALYVLIWPAYQDPIARMYTSKLGYASVIRKTGKSFPVQASVVQRRVLEGRFLGEGLVQSEPVQVPMIAMSRILTVNAVEGQRVKKGDLIVELDQSRIAMKIQSAEAALQTARAELDRVRIGTVNVLQEERSDILQLRAQAAAQESIVARERVESHRMLAERGVMSSSEFATSKLAALRAELEKQQLQIAAKTARAGRESSILIGQAAIREAELTLAHRKAELRDYASYAPCDGIVERVLVHSGEYNQDPGRPAVLLASGLWFECYLDQTALGKIQLNDSVEVRLSAYQDRVFTGVVSHIRPLVNFSLGGPETNRPIRPLGTGAPEWPATFSIRVLLHESSELIVPGLTGYAAVIQKRETLSIPRGSVTAVSGNRGIVFVVENDSESFSARNVVTGIRDERYVEIREGLSEGDTIISDGYQVLEPGDRIAIRDHYPPLDDDGIGEDATNTLRFVGRGASDPNPPPQEASQHRQQ